MRTIEKPLTLMRPILGRGRRRNNRAARCVVPVGLVLLLGLLTGPSWASGEGPAEPLPVMPLDDLQAGMKGIGWSFFGGAKADTFGVEVLGIQRGTGPKSSLILFRGDGNILDEAGIIAGMSGSPVTVDGKLIGAIAYAYPYAKMPIGAITPIEEMLPLLDLPADSSLAGSGPLRLRGPDDGGPGSLLSWMKMAESPQEWVEALLDGAVQPFARGSLAPIRAPVAVSAGAASDLSLLQPVFDALGWIPGDELSVAAMDEPLRVAGGGWASTPGAESGEPLGPGSAIGVRLISGDANLAVTGTVTYRSGDHVLAFGHPMFFAGALTMPLTRVKVHGVLPSRVNSFKLSSALDTVGSLVHDRRTGIYGVLGREAETLPATVRLETPQGEQHTYSFDLVRHQLLTPLLLAWAASNSFDHLLAHGEPATADVTLKIDLEDGRILSFDDLLASRQPGSALGILSTQIATYLLSSTFAPFPVRSVDLDAKIRPGVRRLYIERVEAERSRVRPGERLPVRVLLRRHEGESEWQTHDVLIPEHVLEDHVIIIVSSLQELLTWDQERAPEKYSPRDFEHLYSLLTTLPSQSELIVRVYSPSAGAILAGRELGSLPGSVLRTLRGTASQGTVTPVSGLLVHEDRIPMNAQVVGGIAIQLEIDRKGEP